MQLKKLEKKGAKIVWPKTREDLPVLTWEQFQEQHKSSGRQLIVVDGFIHDVEGFDHPGGQALLRAKLGKDASTAFNGGK